MHCMLRLCRFAVLLMLVAIVPVRAIAAVTIDFCADGNSPYGTHSHDGDTLEHGSDGDLRGHDEVPVDNGHSSIYCAAQCASAAYAAGTGPFGLRLGAAVDRTPFGARMAQGFLPDLLDRPPLVS